MNTLIRMIALAGLVGLPIPGRAGSAPPAAATAPVGVDEKLGAQVPMDLMLNDENGQPVRLGALIDKPTVLTLNYFRCAGICTPLLNGVTDVINLVPSRPGQEFQTITVSFDPADTAEVARMKQTNYLKEIKRPIAPAAWRFLTGPAASTKALCDAVGFRFQAQGDGFSHAGVIMLLSPQGKVTRYLYGTSFLPADLQMAIREAVWVESRAIGNQQLQVCCNYRPEGRGYVFSVTKAGAALTFLLGAGFLAFLVFKKKAPEVKS